MAEEKDLELDDEEGSGKGSKKLIIIIVLVVILLGSGGALFFVMSSGDQAPVEGGEEEVVEEPKEALYESLGKPIVANFMYKKRQRYLQVGVSFMTRYPEVIDAIKTHKPAIKNDLIMVFNSQNYAGLSTPEGRQALNDAALEAVQKVLEAEIGQPGVERVYFTQYVLQ